MAAVPLPAHPSLSGVEIPQGVGSGRDCAGHELESRPPDRRASASRVPHSHHGAGMTDVAHHMAIRMERTHGIDRAWELAESIAKDERERDRPTASLWSEVFGWLDKRYRTVRGA